MNTTDPSRGQPGGAVAEVTRIVQRAALVLLAATFAACASAPAPVPEPRPDGQGRVEITLTGFPSAEGRALVALFLSADGWPDGEGSPFATAVATISDGRAAAVFDNVPAGPFAVSAYHDTDGNHELDTGMLGIPSEAYGFSAGARNTFGPPAFDEARLELAAGETKRITIEVE